MKKDTNKDMMKRAGAERRQEDIDLHGKQTAFRPMVTKNKKAYTRKEKHKANLARECKSFNISEADIRKMVGESVRRLMNESEELDYDMQQLNKAMQKVHGNYHATSSDGKFNTGDRVIVHMKDRDIEGTISDFDTNIMTWKEVADVEYEKEGKTWTMCGVPLDKMEKVDDEPAPMMEGFDAPSKVMVKCVECYNEDDDIVFVAATTEYGDDNEAISKVKKMFPSYDIVDVTDVDGILDTSDVSAAQMSLIDRGVMELPDSINSVEDLNWL